MPRKTAPRAPMAPSDRVGFNEAAARCRGKPQLTAVSQGTGVEMLQ